MFSARNPPMTNFFVDPDYNVIVKKLFLKVLFGQRLLQ